MCNRYRTDPEWREAMGEFSDTRLPVFDRTSPRPNVQGPDIYPAYTGEILAVDSEALVSQAATWLFVPFWFKKSFKEWRKTNGGCNNAKGETAETSGVFKHAARNGRCLIPGSSFFEYGKVRGADGKLPQFQFTPVDGKPFFFGGLRGRAEPEEGPMLTYTMVTKPPGPDVQSIQHHRQPVILAPDQLADWLDPSRPITDFLEPSPAGTFRVEQEVKAARA
jgi:putative SOS response-associated peptidase YedK